MKKLICFLVVAGAAGFAILNYHFILFDSSLKIIRKTGVRYENTFVDARGTKKLQIALNPDLIGAGVQDVIDQVTASN